MEFVDTELHCRKNRLRCGHFTVELLNVRFVRTFSGATSVSPENSPGLWLRGIHLAASTLRAQQRREGEWGINIQPRDSGLLSLFSLGHLTSASWKAATLTNIPATLCRTWYSWAESSSSLVSPIFYLMEKWSDLDAWREEDLGIQLFLIKISNKSFCCQLSSYPWFQRTCHLQFLNPSRLLWYKQMSFFFVS